jgi:carboxyl-terminal processing protease
MKKSFPAALLFTLLSQNAVAPKQAVSLKAPFPFASSKTEVTPSGDNNQDMLVGMRILAEIIEKAEEKCYRRVNFKNFFEEALKAALPECDPHSAFFSQKAYKSTKESTSGEFSGIGISIIGKTPAEDELIITDVLEGGPSEKAGLKAGDKIVEIDGEKVRGLSSDECISKMRGKTGTKVKIKVIRDKDEKKFLDFTLVRGVIKNDVSSLYHFRDQNIYYLSLRLFTEDATVKMKSLLQKANNNGCSGIILDLRRNPGGILDTAVSMASLFVPRNSLVVSTKNRSGQTVSQYHTTTPPVLTTDVPIFILIDNFTASASEILAGALRHYSDQERSNGKNPLRVFILGSTSFGKGSVQEVMPISNGCAIKLTTMLYFLPDDTSIQAKGIEPDFALSPKTLNEQELRWVKEFSGAETTLKNHIKQEEINGRKVSAHEQENKKPAEEKSDKDLSWQEKRLKSLHQDNEIQSAVSMISILNKAKASSPQLIASRSKSIEFLKKNILLDKEGTISKEG